MAAYQPVMQPYGSLEQSRAWLKLQNGLPVLVVIDAVSVMAAYQPVMQPCGSLCEPYGCITGLLPDDGSCVNRNMSEHLL